jgi:hypothetical protein
MHLGGATYVLDPLFNSTRFAFSSAFFLGPGRLHGRCEGRHLGSVADDGCGLLVVPHGEAIIADEPFVDRREIDVSALDGVARALEARTDESHTAKVAAL